MACHCRNNRLLYLFGVQKLANTLGGFITVHYGHITIHEYYVVVAQLVVIFGGVFLYHIDS